MPLSDLAPSIYRDHLADDPSKTLPKESLTVLIGAGGSIYAGGPSTEQLTEIVRTRETLGFIYDILVASNPAANFEDVLHVLEELIAFQETGEDIRESNALQPFVSIAEGLSPTFYKIAALRSEQVELMELIAGTCANMDYDNWKPLYVILRPLLERFNLDIYTLNYDLLSDVVALALSVRSGKPWTTGFASPDWNDKGQLFLPNVYAKERGKAYIRLAHLHGAIDYGFGYHHVNTENRRVFGIRRFDTIDEAKRNRQQLRGFISTSATRELGPAPLISGLRKSQKLNVRPFGNYFQAFTQALSESPNLLAIGYGGGDPHINFWLNEFIDVHEQDARFVEITLGRDHEAFLVQKLRSMNLAWSESGPRIFVNDGGKMALVVTGGLSERCDIPLSDICRHLAS